MKTFLSYIALLAVALGASSVIAADLPLQKTYSIASDPTADVLDQKVTYYRVESMPVTKAFSALGRSFGVSFVVEPEAAAAVVALEINNGTLRDVVRGLTEPYGLFAEKTGFSYSIRHFKVVNYFIDYPQLTRSGQGSSSISLTGNSNGQGGNSSGSSQGMPNSQSGLAGLGGMSGMGNSGGDSTSIQITQSNQNNFWSTIEAELKSMLSEGERLTLNKFSGIAQISAPPRRQETLKEFIDTLNGRINQQVIIDAKIVEVTLNDDNKLGIDWVQAATKVGGFSFNGFGSATNIAAMGGDILPPDSFTASLASGKLAAVLKALTEQGEVKTVSQPRIRTLNNQTAMVKVGTDRVFFSLASSTVINQGGTGSGFATSQEIYSQNNVTIGTVLALTPQVSANGSVTIDVLPALTRLESIETSPDNKQTAPNTQIKTASTIVRLKDGETAVIGGLIMESEGRGSRGVPYLSKIPGVGKAFRTDSTTKSRTELVIFLTAHVVKE